MAPARSRRGLQTLEVPLSLGGDTFHFKLNTRPLSLGPDVPIQYYWIDSSRLRALNSHEGINNYNAIVGYWAAAMREIGCFDHPDQQLHFVLARAYRLIARQKGVQSVFRDAFVETRYAQHGEDALPDDLRERVKDVVQSRNRARLAQEFDDVLEHRELPVTLEPFIREAFRRWAVNGVVALRGHGTAGVDEFLEKAGYWLKKFRKRSAPWIRHFLNLFAYEAKVAFYTCYANAWLGLIPWLREHRDLDDVGERFLRTWHYQNQPVEAPPGRTLSGLFVPLSHGAIAAARNGDGVHSLQAIEHLSEPLGTTRLRDVFRGQVLALHPLSAFFMKDAELCAVAGRFFGGPAHDFVFRRGGADLSPEYWDLIGAILSAAHLYRRAVDRQQRRTGRAPLSRDSVPAEDRSAAGLLEEYAGLKGIRCSCGGALRANIDALEHTATHAILAWICTGCHRPSKTSADWDEMSEWLLGS
jgi:hypothetical protein